jgi:NADH-quinone oxidoreductase subunit N
MDFSLLGPELLLATWGCAVLLIDLILPDRASRRPLLWFAVLGIVCAGVLSLALLGRAPSTTLNGFFVLDTFAIFFKIVFLVAAGLVILGAETFVERIDEYQAEFYGVLLFATTGLMLMAATSELMSVYLSLELSSLSLAFLATWSKRNLKSTEAGMKFFILSAMSSAVLLYGMALLYGLTGSTSLRDLGQLLTRGGNPATLLAMCMLVAGFGFKIAAVPFHMWTPDVYEGAPTPVTAFMSTASKAAGFAVLLRIFETSLGGIQQDWQTLFAVLAALTMTLGNVMALVQNNVKRMLAYSSIGHVGYMLMGLAIATPQAFSAVMFHLLVYAFTNVGAFGVLIVMSRYVKDEDIRSYTGLWRRAPGLALTMAFCLLSLAGLPPLAGFFSKLFIFFAAAESGVIWLVVFGVVNSAISLYYYPRVIRQMWLPDPAADQQRLVSVSAASRISLAAAVLGILVISPFSGAVISAALGAAQSIAR